MSGYIIDHTKETQISDAIRLLRGSGYVVIKETNAMREAIEECERKNFNGDCTGCSASICVYDV